MSKKIQVFLDMDHLMYCQFHPQTTEEVLRKEKLFLLDLVRDQVGGRELSRSSMVVRKKPLPDFVQRDPFLRSDRLKIRKWGYQFEQVQYYNKYHRCFVCDKVHFTYKHKQVNTVIIHEAMSAALHGNKQDLICIVGDEPIYRNAIAVLAQAGYNAELWTLNGKKLTVHKPDSSWTSILPHQDSDPNGGRQIFWDISHVCFNAIEGRGGKNGYIPFSFARAMQGISGGRGCGLYSSYYGSVPPSGAFQYMSQKNENLFKINGYQSVRFPLADAPMRCYGDDGSGCGRRWTIYHETSVDTGLIIGMYQAAFAEDNAHFVLVSTDGDFLPTVRSLYQKGHTVDVWGFKKLVKTMSRRTRSGVHYNHLEPFLTHA